MNYVPHHRITGDSDGSISRAFRFGKGGWPSMYTPLIVWVKIARLDQNPSVRRIR